MKLSVSDPFPTLSSYMTFLGVLLQSWLILIITIERGLKIVFLNVLFQITV